MSEQEYYIAKVKCYEMKTFDGTIITKENHEVKLGMSEGYPSLGNNSEHKFKSIAEILTEC